MEKCHCFDKKMLFSKNLSCGYEDKTFNNSDEVCFQMSHNFFHENRKLMKKHFTQKLTGREESSFGNPARDFIPKFPMSFL